MTAPSRQAIADACGKVLRELDDLRPEMAATNAALVAAIDELIVARIADAMVLWTGRDLGQLYLQRERGLTEAK